MTKSFVRDSIRSLCSLPYILTLYTVAGITLGALTAYLVTAGMQPSALIGCVALAVVPTHFLVYGLYRRLTGSPIYSGLRPRKRRSFPAVYNSSEELLHTQNALAMALAELEQTRTRTATPSAEVVKVLFRNAGSPLDTILTELVSMELYSTFDDAAMGLSRLAMVVRQISSPPLIEWTQRILGRVLTNGITARLTPPGRQEMVLTKALECYAALIPQMSERDVVNAAVRQVKLSIGDARTRREAVRNLLVPLLNWQPTSADLLEVYHQLFYTPAREGSREEEDVFKVALLNIPQLTNLDPHNLLSLLDAALTVARRSPWRLGDEFFMTAHRLISAHLLQQTDLHVLLSHMHHYMDTEGSELLEDARRKEYLNLCKLIVILHKELGTHRLLRPRNRHVVQGLPGITANIEFPDSEEMVVGHVQNFGLGEAGWTGGAWVVTGDDTGRRDAVPGIWIRAKVTLGHPVLNRPITMEAMVRSGQSGFRVMWTHLTVEDAAGLERLAQEYPITR
jgi:hypothetical protein